MSIIITALVIVALIVVLLTSLGTVSKIVGWLCQAIGKGCTYLTGCGCLLILVAALLALVGGCNVATTTADTDADSTALREGDILLQVAAPSEFVNAIVASSAAADTLQFAHCAMMVAAGADSLVVLEATTPGGVKYTALDEFLSESDSIGGRPAVIVMRVNADRRLDVTATVARATSRIGQEYDWSFLPDNGKTYCSELLQTSYIDSDGNPLFATIPLNFKDAEGNFVAYWIELYKRLGEEIPQGVDGTSPSSIAHADCLHEVTRFF